MSYQHVLDLGVFGLAWIWFGFLFVVWLTVLDRGYSSPSRSWNHQVVEGELEVPGLQEWAQFLYWGIAPRLHE